MKTIKVYTDGACSGNQFKENKGGWGALLIFGKFEKEISGATINTTNNKMELQACIEALTAIKIANKHSDKHIALYTDSAYIYNAIEQEWYKKWQNNNWKSSNKSQVKNLDQWKELIELYQFFDSIEIIKVKGHNGNPGNERADFLATQAINSLI